MDDIITLTQRLVSYPSISPDDAGCQAFLADLLETLGFSITTLPKNHSTNLWAHYGEDKPLFVFAGHTDVVTTGNLTQWKHDPFTATINDNKLYGRGVADMKGSLAAMYIATKRFLTHYPNPKGSIGFMLTSAEEGEDFLDGTPVILNYLQQQQRKINYCVLGEPTAKQQSGDTIKVGRRGSLTGHLTIYGQQGHIAYPHLANNPIHVATPIIHELASTQWDQGNEQFEPTSFQISNIQGGTGAGNVIPGELKLQFNFRYSPASTHTELKQRVGALLKKQKIKYDLHWVLNGEPYQSQRGELLNQTVAIIEKKLGMSCCLSTSGGTSDGRFIAPFVDEIIELGPSHHSIHQINEYLPLTDLTQLAEIYFALLERLLN